MSTATKSGISITTRASGGGNIDYSDLTLQVSTPATISSGSTAATTTKVVSESTTFRLTFSIPVPMDANWKVDITFPPDIPISSFTEVNGYGVFGSKKELVKNTTVDTTNNKVTILSGITSYTTTDFNAILEFISITNPVSTKTTDSFEFLLMTTDSYLIGSLTSGVTYTATTGDITSMTATPDATTVGITTSVLFSFKPTHKIPASSRLLVTLPSEASISARDSGSCSLSNLSEIQLSATCNVAGRLITISNPFSADFVQDGSKEIQFKIDDVIMPGTTAPSSAGIFQTCYLVDEGCYNIDRSTQNSLLVSTVGTLTSVTVVPTSLVAYNSTIYEISIVPAHDIPVGGVIVIDFPPEVDITNPTYTANSCTYSRRMLNTQEKGINRYLASTGLENTFTCSANSSSITVNDGFSSSTFNAGGTISFDVNGIRNPVSLEPSSSFNVTTQTSGGYDIDKMTSGITVTMALTYELQLVTLSSSTLVNGATNELTVTVNSPSQLVNGDILVIVFPSAITLPNTVNTIGVSNLDSIVTNSLTGRTLEVTLDFSDSTTLAAGTTFSFKVNSIINPTSTEPTDNFLVSIKNTNGYLVNNYDNDLKLTTTTGAEFTSASIATSTLLPSATNDITFTVTLAHAVPAGGMLTINYPSQVSVNSSTLAAELSRPSTISSLTISLLTSEKKITITDMFPSDAAAGTEYVFTLKNLENPDSAGATNSFEITTYTGSSGAFKIDTIRSGLTFTIECDYPCATCSATDSSACDSCVTTTPELYLQNNNCVTECDVGKLPITGVCENCNDTCVACDSSEKDVCTKCGKEGYEFLSGTTCVGTCPDGTFGNELTNECESCDTASANCLTCSRTAFNCTSCITSPTQHFLYGNTCVSSCPSGEAVLDTDANTCNKCDSNCKTCSGTTKNCTS